MSGGKREFPSVALCDPSGRESHAVAADLDGTLLVSRSSFPYFMLLAVEAGGFLRGLLLLATSPLVLLLYTLVSEAVGIQLLIFVSVAGIKIRDVELAARAVLPRFYAADVRADSWAAFAGCGRRRVVVTANPTVMVEPFVKGWLGGDRVLGTELEVDRRSGRATGFVVGKGVLVGGRKREAVEMEFAAAEGGLPELGLGDRESDHDFMALCKEGYMVHPDRSAARVPLHQLRGHSIFHDARFVRRPDPLTALLTFLWTPLGFLLSLPRLLLLSLLPLPSPLLRLFYRLCFVDIAIRGTPPPTSPGTLFVCNHRTAHDHAILRAALGRSVTPVPAASAPMTISARLRNGEDFVICPEGTTCREPFLLRFDPGFAELSHHIVPVALNTKQSVFHGDTVRGYEFMNRCFFFMNPRPTYEVTFLDRLPEEQTCRGGKSPADVATHVQRLLAETLGFECTALTRNDKYLMLGGVASFKVE